MARTDNISRYVCDKCGKTEYFEQGRQASGWMEIERYNADRVPVKKMFCAACHEMYKPVAAQADSDFNDFMAGE